LTTSFLASREQMGISQGKGEVIINKPQANRLIYPLSA
jgi:hypothetical protein